MRRRPPPYCNSATSRGVPAMWLKNPATWHRRQVQWRFARTARIEPSGRGRLSTWEYRKTSAFSAWFRVEAATGHHQVGDEVGHLDRGAFERVAPLMKHHESARPEHVRRTSAA
jgi:hypothetical protein